MKQVYCLFISLALICPAFAHNAEDTTDGHFHDDLLNHLVGSWDATSVAHGSQFTLNFQSQWVMNHQYLRVHFKSNEVVPWLGIPFEAEIFFGYNHINNRYTVHAVTVHGDNGPYEGFCYAYRHGDVIETVANFGLDSVIVQRFTWYPAGRSWNITSRWVIAGKEGDVFLDMKLVAAKIPSTKRKQSRK